MPDAGPAAPVRVLVVDDEALVRAGFRVLVESSPGLSVVGEAADGAAAVRQCRGLRPDVLLMDIRLLFKLSARDRAQLVVIAYETGLVRPAR